jgi:hypothetical protein
MKALVVLLIAGLALSGTAGLALAQSAKQPVTSTTTSTPLPKAKLHSLAGQVVSVDQAAKSLIVKRTGKNPQELTFAVDEKAPPRWPTCIPAIGSRSATPRWVGS